MPKYNSMPELKQRQLTFSVARCHRCKGHTGAPKAVYLTKRAAKLGAKRYDRTMKAYRCPHGNGWHTGHMDQSVIKGERTRDQWLNRTS